ncbi:C-Jun-amino-terminal kinase-interacting protein 4-like isoform X3 [Tachypleus tridentatus]|uniref:C-Jun-amino-terminal kinase-interacting protein 4-like isoform X3 n=1 Tax=Tachypleus tridentatus TaxID=6853 RepID=UPI003FD12116
MDTTPSASPSRLSPLQETVYVTSDDAGIVMSEKVQNLAGRIYQEFEKMIRKYDEDVVKELMPLVVNVLENLDLSCMESQEHEVELELLREDNEQLVTQYEREKQLRKHSDQKLLEVEFRVDEVAQEYESKLESLESLVRLLELKAKNASDHASRLEEKEGEMKKEYTKLHERYTELFKTHLDYMERTKMLLDSERGEMGNEKSSRPILSLSNMKLGSVTQQVNSGEDSLASLNSPLDFPSLTSPNSSLDLNTNLKNELQSLSPSQEGKALPLASTEKDQRGWAGEFGADLSETLGNTPDQEDVSLDSNADMEKVSLYGEERRANNLYQEISHREMELEQQADTSITDFFGMGRELESLIMENSELLATKNALNIVKDDLISKVDELTGEQQIMREEIKSLQAVRDRLRQKVLELEEDLKKSKEETQKLKLKSDDEEEIPLAQRKRFTRLEMARVLMERNQYKERLMELQEAVRFTEMIRATRHDVAGDKKRRSSIWKFFSNLFSGTDKQRNSSPSPSLKSCISGSSVVDSPRKKALSDRHRGLDFSETELASEKLHHQRAKERREQLKQVRAHMQKDEGRIQACGWSVPNKTLEDEQNSGYPTETPVPVPVYCRLLQGQDPGMKIWCAVGIDLTCSKSYIPKSTIVPALDAERESIKEAETLFFNSEENSLEALDKKLSSFVWIGSSSHTRSKVTVISANNPASTLDSFHVCSAHLLCMASVPGAKDTDYPVDESLTNFGSDKKLSENEEQGFTVFKCMGVSSLSSSPEGSMKGDGEHDKETVDQGVEAKNSVITEKNDDQKLWKIITESELIKEEECVVTPDKTIDLDNLEEISSALPTVWLGSQRGRIYLHSAVAHWRRCLHSIRLNDSVLSIVHTRGRVFVALADGTVAVFHRCEDGQWDLINYHIVDLGHPHQSIRCLSVVDDHLWCGHRNRVQVIDAKTLTLTKIFDAHPRKESQVRQMVRVGDGVWIAIRLDSTLRLYDAQTYAHLQDVDVEPYVSKMLGAGKLGFSLVRITALLASCNRLWLGTGNGVIISIPLSSSFAKTCSDDRESSKDVATSLKFIPYCSMVQAQLSFHGHQDVVKFFVSVPGQSRKKPENSEDVNAEAKPQKMLVISGGEGYVDFRVGEDEEETEDSMVENKHFSTSKGEQSHLIVWQVTAI